MLKTRRTPRMANRNSTTARSCIRVVRIVTPMSCCGPLRPPNQLTLQHVDSFHRKSIQQSPPLSRRALLSSDQFNGPFESSDPATTPDRRQLENRPREPVRSYRAAACAATATGRSTRMSSAASPTRRAVRRAVRATPRYVSIGLETHGPAQMLRGLRARITRGRWACRVGLAPA